MLLEKFRTQKEMENYLTDVKKITSVKRKFPADKYRLIVDKDNQQLIIVDAHPIPISNAEILDLVENRELDIAKLIDVVIKRNGIIGVGLISLGDNVRDYIQDKCKPSNQRS